MRRRIVQNAPFLNPVCLTCVVRQPFACSAGAALYRAFANRPVTRPQ
ncbi:MAG: hypothetical protein IMX00_10330 [Limnochordales bacterium]|nr:hypothetical protein [Limnochordales bacterium]